MLQSTLSLSACVILLQAQIPRYEVAKASHLIIARQAPSLDLRNLFNLVLNPGLFENKTLLIFFKSMMLLRRKNAALEGQFWMACSLCKYSLIFILAYTYSNRAFHVCMSSEIQSRPCSTTIACLMAYFFYSLLRAGVSRIDIFVFCFILLHHIPVPQANTCIVLYMKVFYWNSITLPLCFIVQVISLYYLEQKPLEVSVSFFILFAFFVEDVLAYSTESLILYLVQLLK